MGFAMPPHLTELLPTIFAHKEEYFPNPETKMDDVIAFVIGVLTDFEDPGLSEINKQLDVVLYKNPSDSGSVLSSHAHVLTLKQPVCRTEGPVIVEVPIDYSDNAELFKTKIENIGH